MDYHGLCWGQKNQKNVKVSLLMVQQIDMPKKERNWGHNVKSEMVLWYVESRPQVKLTISWGQFVAI